MEDERKECGNCLHFTRHYAISRAKFVELNCGHCCVNLIKRRAINQPACQHWTKQKDLKTENIEYIDNNLKTMAKQVAMFAEYFENIIKEE